MSAGDLGRRKRANAASPMRGYDTRGFDAPLGFGPQDLPKRRGLGTRGGGEIVEFGLLQIGCFLALTYRMVFARPSFEVLCNKRSFL